MESRPDDATLVTPAARPTAHPFLSPPELPDEIGRLGAFRILAELGRGGMGVVFRAEDVGLKRLVALKVMLPTAAGSPGAVARFLREAEAQAKVEHDHVTPIYRVDEANGVPFLAMPLLKGQTLGATLKQNRRPPVAEVVRIGREMAEGLAAAHEAGLIHRDIKPANVWLEGGKRRVKILDFGLARVAHEPAADGEPTVGAPVAAETAPDCTQLTAAGAIVGTPAYMSPEQARGLSVDHRTDLFSLGVVLYEMAAGRMPFTGPSAMDVMTAVVTLHPAPAHEANPEVPAALSELIRRLLAKDAAARPVSAEAVADELKAIARLTGTRTTPALPTVGEPNPWADIETTSTDAAGEVVRAGPEPRRSRWVLPAVAVAALALATALALVAAQSLAPKPTPEPEPVAAGPKPLAPAPKAKPKPKDETATDFVTSSDWQWTEPENLGPAVNSAESDLDPAVSGDALRLVFQSSREGQSFLYEVRRKTTAEPFGERKRLDALGVGGEQPYLSLDGLHVVFVADRPGGRGRKDYWESRRADRDAPWSPPRNLGPPTNDAWDDTHPAVSPDGLTLYMAKWSKWIRAGEKNYEVAISRRPAVGDPWGPLAYLPAEVNSPEAEIAPRPLSDGKGFVFTRLIPGGQLDWLCAVGQPGGGWEIKLVRGGHKDFNPTFTADGKTAIFQSDRPGGQGKYDLWQTRLVTKK